MIVLCAKCKTMCARIVARQIEISLFRTYLICMKSILEYRI